MTPWFLPLKHLELNMNMSWIDFKMVKKSSEKKYGKKNTCLGGQPLTNRRYSNHYIKENFLSGNMSDKLCSC